MNPGQYNFTCPKGTTFAKSVTYKVNKFAVNLTGYSARMQVRETLTSTSTLVSLSTAAGNMTVNSAGVVTMTISAATTAGLPNGTHVYDLEIESGGGVVTRLLEGKFKVTGEVTR
jgi:hypothetical protein